MTGAWQLEFLGDSAVQLRAPHADVLAANAAVHRMAGRVRAVASRGVRDVVPGMRDVIVHVDPLRCDVSVLVRLAEAGDCEDATPEASTSPGAFEVRVTYGGDAGPDLPEVARACGLTPEDVVRRHAAGEYRVCFIGFLPGFPYLGLLDPGLRLPRRATPRARVAPGSVAIAGEYTGIYPWASPGGWHVIGRTEVRLFDVTEEPPARLVPGARVRFVAA